MQRTTVRLPPALMTEAKKLARDTRRTLTQVIEDALRVAVARRKRPKPRTVSIVTFKGNGLQPGVDLDDMSAVYDLMDGDLGFTRR
jgi:hypothetical protein